LKLTKEKFIEIRMIGVEGEPTPELTMYLNVMWDKLCAKMTKQEFTIFGNFLQSATYRKMVENDIHNKYAKIEDEVYAEMLTEYIEEAQQSNEFEYDFEEEQIIPKTKVVH